MLLHLYVIFSTANLLDHLNFYYCKYSITKINKLLLIRFLES